jgi:hypothetical protein
MWASRAVGNTATVCSTSVGPVVVNGACAGCNVWSSIAWETPMIRGSLYGYFTRNGAQARSPGTRAGRLRRATDLKHPAMDPSSSDQRAPMTGRDDQPLRGLARDHSRRSGMNDTVSHYIPPQYPLTSTAPQAFSNTLTLPSRLSDRYRDMATSREASCSSRDAQ